MKVTGTKNKRFHFDNTLFDSPLETADFTVFQAGDLYCGCGFATGEHEQSVPVELTFVDRGSGAHVVNDNPEQMKPNRAYLSLLSDRHDVRSDEAGSLRYFYLAIGVKETSPLSAAAKFLGDTFRARTTRELSSRTAIEPMRRLLREFTAAAPFKTAAINAAITEILIDIYRAETDESPAPYAPYGGDLIRNITTYIDENAVAVCSSRDVADAFFYSVGHVSALFRAATGQGLHAYIRYAKLKKGKELLGAGVTPAETAEKLNYSSAGNFSRDFKAAFGAPPSAFFNRPDKD